MNILQGLLFRFMCSGSLKKVRLLHSFLRLGGRSFASLLAFAKGLRFPDKWSWFSKLEFMLNLYEVGTTSLCKWLIKPGMTTVDVGANIGYYTLLFSKLVGPNGKVYAFEPHPEIFQILKHNIKKRRNVVAFQKAVANVNGEIEFFLSKRTRSHGFFVPNEFRTGSCKVEAVCLEDFCFNEGIAECDFIKIDVEGAEPLAIEGMTNLISLSRRIFVVLEFNPSALCIGHMDPRGFLNMLFDRFDFVYHIEETTGRLSPIVGTTLIKNIPEWHAVNLLCCKGENPL